MNYLSNAEVYADMPKLLRQFVVFAALWTITSLIAILIGMLNAKWPSSANFVTVLLFLIGAGMLGVALQRYLHRKGQFSLVLQRNSLCEDGYLEGYIEIKNAKWQWQADSKIYLEVCYDDSHEKELIAVKADSRIQPRGNNIRIFFSSVARSAFSDVPTPVDSNGCSGKLHVNFLYNGDTFKEVFTVS